MLARLLRTLSLAALLLTGCAGSRPAPPSLRAAQAVPPGFAYPAHDTVRVATYNVEHFVDAFDDPYVRNDREDTPDPAVVAEKGRLLAEAVRALDADVVVFEEMEGEAVAQALADSLFGDLGYRFFATTESPTWYQNVVVMSRLPLGPLTAFADAWTPIEGETTDEGTPNATSLINHRLFAVDVYARPGYTFTLVAAHLKAGGGPRNAAWRLGQIDLLHAYLARLYALDPSANVLVAGDLNLLPTSPEYARLLSAPGRPVRFVDALADAGPAALTHPSAAPERRLDYILAGEAMAPEVVEVRVARPLGTEALSTLSDHLPVAATLLARDR